MTIHNEVTLLTFEAEVAAEALVDPVALHEVVHVVDANVEAIMLPVLARALMDVAALADFAVVLPSWLALSHFVHSNINIT